MLLNELLDEGALKRSDPYLSGEDELPPPARPEFELQMQPKPRLSKKSPFQARLDGLARQAQVSVDKVKDLWVKHSGNVDPKNMNRWAIITRRVKDDLGLP